MQQSSNNTNSGTMEFYMGVTSNLVRLTVFMTLLIFSLILPQNHLFEVAALSCTPCDQTVCQSLTSCPGGLILDVCGCCQVCARVKNQRCGGQFGILGQCDKGLHCMIRSEIGQPITGKEEGICKDKSARRIDCVGRVMNDCPACNIWTNSMFQIGGNVKLCQGQELLCNDDNCPEAYQHKLCPSDSYLTVPESRQDYSWGTPSESSSENNINDNHNFHKESSSYRSDNLFLMPGQTSYCVCNSSACKVPLCVAGYSLHLARVGTGLPGSCCSVYVCRKPEECGSVMCPPYEEGLCPEDSLQNPSRWTEDGCCEMQQGCSCPSDELCESPWCPEGFQAQIISRATRKPGSCCDKYLCVKEVDLSCSYEGKELANGETWHVNKCRTCQCRNSVIKCKDKHCKNLPCSVMITPEGECCPVCRGCLSESGNLYNESSVWLEDGCTTCTCLNGEAQCKSEMCSVPCTNPKYLLGQCCPVCPGKCTFDCQFGLKVDTEGNVLCECKGAEDRCPPWEEGLCEKKCEYGYKRSRHGCLKCKCKKCPQFNCIKRCLHGHMLSDEGCPLCKCKDTAATELSKSKFDPENIEGKPCMSWYGSRHEDGESWNDGCRLCYCRNGAEMCSLIACPVPLCLTPVFRIGDCCPSCPGLTIITDEMDNEMCQSSQGQYYVEGETWKMDQCTECMCHKGTILCDSPTCPPVTCHYPLKPEGQCCPICQETDVISTSNHQNLHHNLCTLSTGISFKHGEVWRSTPCQSCICRDGQIHCYNQMCLPLNCNRTVQRKGYCCPTCVESGKPKICLYLGVTYGTEEKWEGDNCTQCSCINGQTVCSPLLCPHLKCTFMLRKRGQCCPECADESQLNSFFHGNLGSYKDKNMFNRTETSRNMSSVNANLAGLAVLGIMVLILAIIIFILLIYFMKRRQKSKTPIPDHQGQIPFLSEPLGNTVNSEKHYLDILYPNVALEEGREDRISNNYTEIMFRDKAKDNSKDTKEHLFF